VIHWYNLRWIVIACEQFLPWKWIFWDQAIIFFCLLPYDNHMRKEFTNKPPNFVQRLRSSRLKPWTGALLIHFQCQVLARLAGNNVWMKLNNFPRWKEQNNDFLLFLLKMHFCRFLAWLLWSDNWKKLQCIIWQSCHGNRVSCVTTTRHIHSDVFNFRLISTHHTLGRSNNWATLLSRCRWSSSCAAKVAPYGKMARYDLHLFWEQVHTKCYPLR